MARRLPSQPPVLPGFSYLHVLGSGGFADVFLYEQNMPRRKVAVKVMLSEMVTDQVRQMFQAEANLMAQLSTHPSILTVYEAGVSSDGRPYLVMEFCSSALSERYRRERIPVPEVLRVAIRVGSAIETAHRAGILHRDIKPSNILLTAYGHPVLSDFGIAASLADAVTQEAVGMSIPWSAPEVLHDDTPGTVRSEVWAFAATVYTLLAGRSPFELPGEQNRPSDLMSRIDRARVQPIGRADVPASLERMLQAAMSRKPDARPESVLDLVHQLQSVESELGVSQTAAEVAMDDWARTSVSDLEDKTRVRGVATAVNRIPRRRRRAVGDDVVAIAPVLRSTGSERRTGSSTHGQADQARKFRWWLPALIGAGVLVVGLGSALTATLVQSGRGDIPVVTNIESVTSGTSVEFTWDDPGILPGDNYQISTSAIESTIQSRAAFTVDGEPGDTVCISISVNREGREGARSNEKCVELAP
ncbi:serine/threonine-protein kinase [Marisediminicola senii]|uniref:serine/threonine-protein kinase n=1 Tax=Marisediminicola senii TaxID=2711233 RepID=UPI0013EDE99C|nr:serine/threonine-protein kinase [Marisediminicola senii]